MRIIRRVLEQLKAALATATKNLGIYAARHELVKRRIEAKRKKERKLRERAHQLDAKADAARREGRHANALRLSKRATKARAAAGSVKAHKAALIDLAKALHKKRHAIKTHIAELGKLIADAKSNDGITVNVAHNTLSGGSLPGRIKLAGDIAVAQCAKGARDNYYDQGNAWNCRTPFTGPKRGRDRSDCSAEIISWFYVAKGPSPSGTYNSGWTGSMVDHGHQITLEQAKHCTFAYIIYGPGPGHHTEKAKGDGTTRTQGHGSGPVDEGDFFMLGGMVRAFVPREMAAKV